MVENMPLYLRIYHDLLGAIHAKAYPVGSLLPTEQALCQQYGVSRITSKRALDLLAQEGYVARVKGRGSTVLRERADALAAPPGMLLGVVMPDFSETFGVQMLYGIEQACAESGVSFVLKLSRGDLETEKKSINDLIALGVSGIAVVPLHGEYYNEAIVRLVIEGFPVVVVDRRYPGINSSFVGTDNAKCAAAATEYLLELGHRRIAWVSPQMIHTSTLEDRVKGFTDTLVRRKLSANRKLWYAGINSTLPMRNTPALIRQDVDGLAEHLRAHPEITAVFAAEYNIALLVRQAAKALSLRIPEDLSVVCFDAPLAFDTQNEPTYIRQQEKHIGEQSIALLLEMIRAEDRGHIRRITLPGRLVIGASTAPPSAGKEA